MDKTELIEFLLKAKKSTYAGSRNQVKSSRPTSNDFSYSQDRLMYYDSYLGSDPFSGEEILFLDQQAIWGMNYMGRKLDTNFDYNFLKEALQHVSSERPFRGPRIYQNSDYIYKSGEKGDFNWFQGYETIEYKGQLVYECYYHGGSLN